jgi:nicotinamidase-related amidase
VSINTTTSPIKVDPSKSALVIIDMQNFFLSESFGRGKGAGHRACDNLVNHAIPAARKADIRVIWLNWGLTDEDIKTMPPAVRRAFGFFAIPADSEFSADGFAEQEGCMSVDKFGEVQFQGGDKLLENGTNGAMYRGLGAECGNVELQDGSVVDAGRLLMRDAWNSALYPPLGRMYEEGRKLEHRPDVWFHKNRMSGCWGPKTEFEEFMEREGIRTLFLSGVNTDQCVGGTFVDAFSRGYDCVLLSDGCGTTSPGFAQQCFEFNAARTFGFCTSCEDLAKGVEMMDRC